LFPLNHLLRRIDIRNSVWLAQSTSQTKACLAADSIPQVDSASGSLLLEGVILDTIATVGAKWTKLPYEEDIQAYKNWAQMVTNGKEIEVRCNRKIPQFSSYCSFIFWLKLAYSSRLRTTDVPYGSATPSEHPMFSSWNRNGYRWKSKRPRINVNRSSSTISAVTSWTWGRLSNFLPYASIGRRLAHTKQSYIALVPEDTKAEDLICYFNGGGMFPFVLREYETGYQFIGACYVHGFFTPGTIWTNGEKRKFQVY
jgi:hypothetical protein